MSDYDPKELVHELMHNDPTGDLAHIQRAARDAVLKGDSLEYLPAFIDATTAACYRAIIKAERQTEAEAAAEREAERRAAKQAEMDALRKKRGAPTEAERKAAAERAKAAQEKFRERQQEALVELRKEFVKIELLNLLMPNGKPLRDCTFGECAQFGGWFKVLSQQGRPMGIVGKHLSEDQVRKIQTWND